MKRHRRCALSLGLVVCFIARHATAAQITFRATPEAPPGGTVYAIDPVPHLVYTLSTLAVTGIAGAFVKKSLEAGLRCKPQAGGLCCDPSALDDIDRWSIDRRGRAWGRASNYLEYTTLGTAAAFLVAQGLLDAGASPKYDAAVDLLVSAEAVATATLVTQIFKYAVRRPRPRMYTPGRFDADSSMSFPSGHTSAVASAAAASATTTFFRHPYSLRGWTVLGVGTALTAFTATGRVQTGAHFLTDVVAGALVGGAAGYLVPYAFARKISVSPSVGDAKANARGLSLGVDISL